MTFTFTFCTVYINGLQGAQTEVTTVAKWR